MQKKGFFQSKIIWLALLGLAFQLIAPLLGREYDPSTGDVEESIIDLIFGGGDWVNIGANVLIIIARWFFTDTKIEGFVKPGAGLLTVIVLVTCLAFNNTTYAAPAPYHLKAWVTSHTADRKKADSRYNPYSYKANLTIVTLHNLPTLPEISPVARLCRSREYKTAQSSEIEGLRT